MNNDRRAKELRDRIAYLTRFMRDINPKLSHHAVLSADREKCQKELLKVNKQIRAEKRGTIHATL